jgi:ABC-type transport system involved in cytochrome c biogenesis permease subunit
VIATYSSLAMVSSAVIYLLAMCAYALEWAAIRRPADTAPGEEAAVSPRASRFGRIGLGLMLVAVLCHVAGVVLRGVAAQRAPWGNMYEFVTSSLGFAALFALYLIWRRGWGWLGLPITLLLAVGQGLAVTVFYVAVAPLVPALHSVWFIIHIVAAAIAGAAFNLGGIAAILYLFRVRAENKGPVRGYLARMPSAATLDDFSFRVTAVRLPAVDLHDPRRRGVGRLRLGPVLGLGPEGDVVAGHLGRVRGLPACSRHGRLEGRAGGLAGDHRGPRVLVQLRGHQPAGDRPPLVRGHLTHWPRARIRSHRHRSRFGKQHRR